MTKDSEDPSGMTPLREAAAQAHEMYSEFRASGFSRGEALELLAKVLTNMMMATVENTDDD